MENKNKYSVFENISDELLQSHKEVIEDVFKYKIQLSDFYIINWKKLEDLEEELDICLKLNRDFTDKVKEIEELQKEINYKIAKIYEYIVSEDKPMIYKRMFLMSLTNIQTPTYLKVNGEVITLYSKNYTILKEFIEIKAEERVKLINEKFNARFK